jgi:hypothetical protein
MLLTLLRSTGAGPAVVPYIKVSGTWQSATVTYIKVSGTWQTATVFYKVSGAWL